jgi:hypothetical protein
MITDFKDMLVSASIFNTDKMYVKFVYYKN